MRETLAPAPGGVCMSWSKQERVRSCTHIVYHKRAYQQALRRDGERYLQLFIYLHLVGHYHVRQLMMSTYLSRRAITIRLQNSMVCRVRQTTEQR
jgi:hypothetical protein